MASESQQRVARPDFGRQTVPYSGRSHRESACRQCSLCSWYSQQWSVRGPQQSRRWSQF